MDNTEVAVPSSWIILRRMYEKTCDSGHQRTGQEIEIHRQVRAGQPPGDIMSAFSRNPPGHFLSLKFLEFWGWCLRRAECGDGRELSWDVIP